MEIQRSLVIAFVLIGCGDDDRRPIFDAGRDSGRVDGGVPRDGGGPGDGGGDDGGGEDGGGDDGGGMDAGGDMDAGTPAGSAAITLVRAAPDGAIDPPIHVEGVTVSYVRPLIGTDPAGFFVQAEATGPALFVAIDPSTLTPVPAEGDAVAFDVTETATVGAQRRVTMMTGFSRTGAGVDPTTLVQDASAVDLVAMLDDYDSELVTVSATIAGAFSGCSAPHRCAQITTAGVATASTSLRFRTTDAIETALGLREGCEIEIGPTPLWRFNTAAQPSAWDSAEVTVTSCPALPAPGAGELVITEIAHAFADSDTGLEWIEITNPSMTASYELGGCTIEDGGGAAAAHTIAGSLVIAPGATVLLAGTMAEVTPDYTLPAGIFGISDSGDTLTLSCGTPAVIVDTVVWPGGGGFPPVSDGVAWQLAPGATTAAANDMGSNWCQSPTTATYGMAGTLRGSPGAANPMCEVVMCPPTTHLVINEIDYDQIGADTREFVEIFNPTAAAIPLASLQLVFVNGSSDTDYRTIDLTAAGTELAAGQYLVVAVDTVTVPSGALVTRFSLAMDNIQNGAPDVVLLYNSATMTVVDFLAYEGANEMVTIGGTALTVTEGATSPGVADSNDDAGSLVRLPNGCDRDMPALDWGFVSMPSPGVAN
jgi:hypothetical protein